LGEGILVSAQRAELRLLGEACAYGCVSIGHLLH